MISRPLLLFCLCSLFAGGTAAAEPTDPRKAALAEPKVETPAEARPATKAEVRLEAKAGDRCEAAVSETIRRMRGREANEVQFVAARRQLLPATDDETGVKGEGRYRAASGDSVPFSYSCAYNSNTEATSGVMFRETGVRTAAAAARPFEPDLTFVSPEACESAAAAALKAKHPRIGRLTFGSDSRRMQPGVNGQVQLSGQGALQRAAGMNAVPFSYRCQVDPRSGRVAGIETSD
jgi:hypothetical protein